jgi:NADH dehydrogenase
MTKTSAARYRVVIVGSGFGGLFAAKSLGRAPDTIEVTLVSRTNHHLFQPLLYQVATGILSEGQIAPPTRDVLKKKKNIFVELAEVTGFDLNARSVTTVQPGGRKVTLSYDSLIVAAGVGQSYFGHDEYSERTSTLTESMSKGPAGQCSTFPRRRRSGWLASWRHRWRRC